jgi:hypothetical protein
MGRLASLAGSQGSEAVGPTTLASSLTTAPMRNQFNCRCARGVH